MEGLKNGSGENTAGPNRRSYQTQTIPLEIAVKGAFPRLNASLACGFPRILLIRHGIKLFLKKNESLVTEDFLSAAASLSIRLINNIRNLRK
jgi:hypothetical protein